MITPSPDKPLARVMRYAGGEPHFECLGCYENNDGTTRIFPCDVADPLSAEVIAWLAQKEQE